jgi:hypothetical protein
MAFKEYQPTVAAGTDLGGTIWSNIAYKKREADRRKYNEKQERLARQHNISLWHMQNEYNHPLQQMERLKAAGLNPNLIYGSSPGSAVGNTGAVSPGSAPKGEIAPLRVSNPMIPFMDTQVKQAQSNNMQADAALKNMQAYKTGVDAGVSKQNLQFLTDTFDARVGTQQLQYEVKQIERDIAKQTKPAVIKNSFSMAEKNKFAAALLNKDLELASQGYVKGNYLGTIMKGVFGLDLSKPTDQKTAQYIVGAVLTSQVAGSFTQAFRNAMQAFTKKKKR